MPSICLFNRFLLITDMTWRKECSFPAFMILSLSCAPTPAPDELCKTRAGQASPWAAVRVGEASNPGPASPSRRARALRALAQMGLQTGGPDELPAPRAKAGDGIRVSSDAASVDEGEGWVTRPLPNPRASGWVRAARSSSRRSFSVARRVDAARAAGPSPPCRRTAVVAVRAFVAGRRRPAGWGRVRGVALSARAAVVLHRALGDRPAQWWPQEAFAGMQDHEPCTCRCWLHVVGPRMPTCRRPSRRRSCSSTVGQAWLRRSQGQWARAPLWAARRRRRARETHLARRVRAKLMQ